MSTVRVDEHLHTMLRSIARQEGRSIGSVIEDAVERYRREKFWASVQDGYARLQADPEQWAAYQQEIDLWDTMAGDGLEGEAPYGTDEREPRVTSPTPPSSPISSLDHRSGNESPDPPT